jgi:hypothetical protein
LEDHSVNPDSTTEDNADRPTARADLRATERAFVADGYRANKTAITRDVANTRGTLPDARELFKIHQARTATKKHLLERAQAKAAHPAAHTPTAT